MRPLSWLLLSLGLLGGVALAQRPAFEPGAVVRSATKLLESSHLRAKPLDDNLSKQWHAAFLAHLDPRRMYFLSTDLAEWEPLTHRLDDLAKQGDFQFALAVSKRYQARVTEAAALAEDCLTREQDFTVDEEMPREFPGYARTAEELHERWRKRIKAELLIETVHGRALADARSQFQSRYRRIAQQTREMTDERLCEIFLDSLAAFYDPHSGFVGPSFGEIYTLGPVRNYEMGLRLEEVRGALVIKDVDPAWHALARHEHLVGWNLIAIRRTNGEVVDLVEMTLVKALEVAKYVGGPLEDDKEVYLELLHPVTLQRRSTKWVRGKRR